MQRLDLIFGLKQKLGFEKGMVLKVSTIYACVRNERRGEARKHARRSVDTGKSNMGYDRSHDKT